MQSLFLASRVAVGLTLLGSFSVGVQAQQQSPSQSTLTLSKPLREIPYQEVMCIGCVVPEWDNGYLLHHEFDKDPSVVTMWDRNGKKVLDGLITLPDVAKVSVRGVGATSEGGVLASGGATTLRGSTHGFIAKTDSTGRVIQSLDTGAFLPRKVCEAKDGTVWSLGYPELDSLDRSNTNENVLRQYSFQTGLLRSFVSLDSISKSRDAFLLIEVPRESFLRCGSERVSVLFWSAARSAAHYVEVDTSNGKLGTWRITDIPFIGARANGFALAKGGRVYVSFNGFGNSDNKFRHGLYELRAQGQVSVATLMPIEQTVTAYECDDDGNCREVLPSGTFVALWGADGDELVVQRVADWWGLSWASVSPSPSSPD